MSGNMLNGENDVSVMAENADESQQRLKEIQIILHHSQNYDLKKLQENISLWENQAVQVRLTEDPLFEMTENTENGELLILSDDSDLCKLCFQRKIPVMGILSTEETKDFNILPYVASGLEELELKFLIGIWQRFQQLPWDIAITNRCRIRESIESDLDSFYEIYRDPSITKYMEDLYQDREIEKVHMRDTILSGYRFYGFGVWTICLKERSSSR